MKFWGEGLVVVDEPPRLNLLILVYLQPHIIHPLSHPSLTAANESY